MERRVGRFQIGSSFGFVPGGWEVLKVLFQEVEILSVDFDDKSKCYEYKVRCADFDNLAFDEKIPYYVVAHVEGKFLFHRQQESKFSHEVFQV